MSTRTFLTQEIRPYKIDVYGLQDNYIGTLQSYNDNFIGQTTEPLIVVSKDGTQSFTCSIPKYYIDPITNERVVNPRWEDTKNGVLAENTRILKAFVNFEGETKVFPFIVDEIKDKRDSHFSTFKEIKANGLAFAELGKIGYKIELNQTLFDSNVLEKDPEALMTIQHWLDQVFPNEKNANGEIIKWLTPWCYEIRMDWSRYPGEGRLGTKVYDDRFVNSWVIDSNTNELIAGGIKESREKSRAIDCKNSNKYNITQDIAKAFEVFCDYEYKTAANGQFIKDYIDENGAVWTGRKVIFYNEAINLNNPLYLNYQKNLQSIERTAESSELYTKLFVTPTESSIMTSGYVTIADTHANPTLDDFILNFDYLHSIGSISDYQMQFAKNYEVEIRKINSHLMEKSPIINELIVDINDQKANAAGYDKQIASARDQHTYYEKLKNSDVTNTLVIINKDNPYYTIFVLEGTMYKASLRLEGIVASSIKGYSGKYDEPLFDSSDLIKIKNVEEIANNTEYNYFILMDEYDFPIAIYSKNAPSDVVLYLDLEYSPKNKYENICASYLNEIDNYKKQKLVAEETIASLESQLDIVQKAYDAKLQEKEELNRKLERIMGPALREGYWTPDRYENISQAYNKECSFNEGIEFTTSLFENEQTSYVDIGNDRIYYPYINISNELRNKWFGHDLNNLILHLQRDFVFSPSTAETVLNEGNYYFLYNSKQYYFTLENKLTIGESLTIKIVGSNVDLLLNNSTSIELSAFLKDAFNITQKFENSTITLGDYLLYNNAGFVFSFKHNENNEIIPILLLNNDKLFSEYKKYSRLAYSFQGETAVYVIDTVITDEPEVSYEIYFPRVFLYNDNVLYASETLVISVNRNEETVQLEKYYDYSILLHEGKPCITLKSTKANPFYNLIDTSVKYNVSYHVSQANEALYLDAKQVAKDNSKPKFSYDISVALISAWEENKLQKMPYIELGQLAYISDPILGVHAATGYVSEITYKLDKPQEDEIKIQNYKTKFEDLFETITASSEAMKNNQVAYDIAAGNFSPDGTISGDVIQTAINNNDFFFNYSTTGVDINPTEGIVLTNKKPYANGVYGQVVLQGGGIFLSDSATNTGERIWNNGITPKGINASLITSGQINTNVIKVFSGDDMTFQWNSEGIYSYKLGENGRPQPDIYVKYSQQGLHLTDDTLENWDDADKVNGHQSLVSLDWDGLTLRNNSGQKTLSADLDGNLTIRGTLKSYDYREGESRLLSTGWKIEPTGYAEFNDLFVRGTISASVFEYEETSAVGGRLLVSPTFILKSEHTNKASIQMAADTPLKIIVPIGVSIANNSFVAGGRTWKLNDVVIFNGKFINKNAFPLIKLGKNINDYPIYETKQLHMVISNLNLTNNTITLTSIAMVDGLTQNLFYGADGNIVDANSAIAAMGGLGNIAGTGDWHLISFGTDGAKEGILLTAIEPNSGSYIDILGKGKDDLTDSTRVRLGDLSGLAANQKLIDTLGATPQGWGLYADNVYLRGAIYATSGKIGSLSINEVENTSDIVNNITTTNTSGQVIINKGALTADSISAGVITTNHLSSQVGEELELSSNKSIALIVDNIEKDYTAKLEVTSEGIHTEVVNIQANLQSQITENKTSISQTSEEIKTEVTRATEAEGKLNSIISQTATEIRSEVSESIEGVNSTISQTARDILLNVSETYTTKQNLNDTLESYYTKTETDAAIKVSSENIALSVSKTYTTKNEFSSALEDYSTKKETSAAIEVSSENILSAVKSTYTTKTDLNSTLEEYYTVAETNAAIETSKTGILSTVSNTYATIDSLGNYALTSWTSTQIEQSAESITAKVESGDITSGKVKTSKFAIDANGVSIATGGTFTVTGNNFTVKDDGSVEMKGKITATEGAIGGWTIGETSLHSGSSNNYVALSSDSTTNSRIWAGNENANAAPFRVEKDGTVTLTKIRVLETNSENTTTGEEKIISLYNQPFWAIWPAYRGAINNLSVEGDTLTISTYGGKSVTFKKAADGELWAVSGVGGTSGFAVYYGKSDDIANSQQMQFNLAIGGNNGIDYSNAFVSASGYGHLTIGHVYTAGANSVSVDKVEAYDEAYKGGNYIHIPTEVTLENSVSTWMGDVSADCSSIFKEIEDSITVDTIAITGNTWTQGEYAYANVTATASNTKYKTQQISIYAKDIYEAGADSITVTGIEASGPVYGDKTVSVNMEATLSDGRKAIFSSSNINCTEIYQNGYGIGYGSGFNKGYEDAYPNGTLSVEKSYSSADKSYSVLATATLGDGTSRPFSVFNIDVSSVYTSGETAGKTAGINSVTISAANITRAAADSYSDSSHNTTIYVKATASNGATESTSFVVSGSNAYAAGRLTEAGTLTLSPSSATTLGYGKSITVKATTTNNTTGKSVTITAPADRYGEGYLIGFDSGKGSYNPTSITRTGYSTSAKTVTVKASNSHQDLLTGISINASEIYDAGWNDCKPTSVTGGTPSYQGGNQYTVALTAKNSAGTIVGTGTCSVDARDAYDDGCDAEAKSLALSQTANKTLAYGESITIKATTTNNTTGKSVKITAPANNFANGAASVTLTKGTWANGSHTVTASNGETVTISIPNVTLSKPAWASNKTTIYAYHGSAGPLGSVTVDAQSIYDAGYEAGKAAMGLSRKGNTITVAETATKTITATPYMAGDHSYTASSATSIASNMWINYTASSHTDTRYAWISWS